MHPPPTVPWISGLVCALSLVNYAISACIIELVGLGPFDPTDPVDMVQLGARSTALIADAGEGWRLWTCHFVHTSPTHLGFNLVLLFFVGGALEQLVRRLDFAALLLGTGSAATLASLLGTPEVSAGASGIVFGLMAAAIAFGVRRHANLGPRVRPYFGLWVAPFLLFIVGLGAKNPTIDQANHFGGLLAGFALGPVLRLRASAQPWARPTSFWPLVVVAFSLASVGLAPHIARGGRPAVERQIDESLTVAIPAHWRVGYNSTGEIEFTTAARVVAVTFRQAPPGSPESQRQWYERECRNDARATATVSGRTPSGMPRSIQHWLRYRVAQPGRAMIRDVYFIRSPDHKWIVMTFDSPLAWAPKYGETKRAMVESIQAARSTDAPFFVSTAALK
jgi:membrane associated rhomboid family serine protease